jgi:hypothetical protein
VGGGGGTPIGGMNKVGTFVDVLDVVNHACFHLRVMHYLRDGVGSIKGFAFEMRMTLTTLLCASALASDNLLHYARRSWRPVKVHMLFS